MEGGSCQRSAEFGQTTRCVLASLDYSYPFRPRALESRPRRLAAAAMIAIFIMVRHAVDGAVSGRDRIAEPGEVCHATRT